MPIAEQKTAQLRVRKNCIIAEGSEGQIFYASSTRARLLIDAGAAELVNVPRPGPSIVKVPGPSETKPAEPAEKKSSFPAGQDGRSTDSASSIESGQAEPSSSSAAAPALPQNNAQPSNRRGQRGKHAR